MTKIVRGEPITLWDSITTLPIDSDIVDDTDGVYIQPGGRSRSDKAMVDIFRAGGDQASGVLTLAANATRANAFGTLTLVAQPTNTKAAGTLTLTGNPADTQTVTIGAKTYIFQTVLTNVNGNVLIGADAAATIVNLVAAIMLGSGSGTLYAAATTAHPTVSAVDGAGDTVVATALVGGTAGNAIATTETMNNATWGGAVLAGGTTETVTVDARVYTFKTVLLTANDVLIGATASDTLDNLIAAINGAAGAGTLYGTSTAVHATVVAAAGAGDTMTATARAAGAAGNSIATTDGMANAGNVWGGATLASGAVAETVTIGSTVYTFVNFLTAAFQVLIGAAATNTIDNLIAAINLAAGAGTLYGTSTTEHPTVGAAAGAGDTMDVTADTEGTAGNAIATTETMASGSWGAVTLAGGQAQETDNTTITKPLRLWGYEGDRWMLHEVLEATSDVTVNGVRGIAYETEGALQYERLALTAGNATPTDSATLGATITPLTES